MTPTKRKFANRIFARKISCHHYYARRSWHRRLGWGDQRGTEAPGHADTGTPSHRACIQSSRGHSSSGARRVIVSSIHDHITRVTDNSSGRVHHPLQPVGDIA